MQVETPGRRLAAAEFVGLALLIFAQAPFVFSSSGPLDTDYGRIFLGPLFEIRAALLDGHALLWDSMRMGGTPYWPLPNTAPGYPPLLLALLVLPPLAATNLMLVAHLLLGAFGTRAVARRLGASRAAGFLAAATFLFAPLSLLYVLNQPWATMALGFLPWTVLQVVRRAQGADWRRCGITAGLCYSAGIWCGGYVVFLPGLIGLGFLALGFAFREPLKRELAASAGMLALLVLTLLGVGAGRLLPAAAWTALTDRADALDITTSLSTALKIGEVGSWLTGTGVLTVLLAAAGAIAALRGRRTGVAPFAFAALVMIAFALGWPQRLFFHRFAPGFDRVRDPRHFWAPLVVFVPVLAAVGFDRLVHLVSRWSPKLIARMRGAAAAATTAAIVLVLGAETRAWGFVAPPRILSLDERVEANALHQELALRAAIEPRFRVHDARDTRPKLKKTADLVRCALGLESIEGLLGNISIAGYDGDFISPSREHGPRLWGLLNCVYVTSEEELRQPALELVGVFDEDPDEINPGTDGPYLYRNLGALPRAYLAHHAILLLGLPPEERTEVLASGPWSPRREILVRADVDDAPSAGFDIVVCRTRAPGIPALAEAARAAGSIVCAALSKDVRTQAFGSGDEMRAITPLADPQRAWNRAEVALGDVPADAWLVLAETYSIYPGWRALVDGVPTPLRIANGAATAIRVPAGARRVTLRYVPPGLALGLGITAASLAAAVAALRFLSNGARRAGEASR